MDPIEAVSKYGFPALCVVELFALIRAYEQSVANAIAKADRVEFETKVLGILEGLCSRVAELASRRSSR